MKMDIVGMPKFNKKQRNYIYKEAFIYYKKEFMSRDIGMCSCIDKIVQQQCNFDSMTYHYFKYTFPEFKKLNPHKSVDPFNKYWWPKDKDRSPFFEKIIEETQPKKRK